MRTTDVSYGKATLRIGQAVDGSWSGLVIVAGKQVGDLLHDANRERLATRLRNLSGTLHPNYFGMEEAIARFLRFMPGGFGGDRYTAHDGERRYKVAASHTLQTLVPLAFAGEATDGDGAALAVAFRKDQLWTHMPSLQESTRLREVLAEHGGAFLKAAAKFAGGGHAAGIAGMRQAMAPHGALTWPIVTYLPFLWSRDRHMFLKPNVTRDFAERIGHRFAVDYGPEIRAEVYESLLDLARCTTHAIERLDPADGIDVQSFIWVVGEYREHDLPKATA